jgi:hypothetical protein
LILDKYRHVAYGALDLYEGQRSGSSIVRWQPSGTSAAEFKRGEHTWADSRLGREVVVPDVEMQPVPAKA